MEVSVITIVDGGAVETSVTPNVFVKVLAFRLIVTVSGAWVVVKVLPGTTVVCVKNRVLAGITEVSVTYETMVAGCKEVVMVTA